MLMHLQHLMQKLGYSTGEADIYLAILALGEGTVSDIARRAGIPRTSCYHVLDKLKRQGVVSSYVKRKRPFWVAEDPEALEFHLREQADYVHRLLPALKAVQPVAGESGPKARFYEGVSGIKEVLNDILKDHFDILALGSLEDGLRVLGDDFHFFIEQRHKIFLKARYITNSSPGALALHKRDVEELRRTRFLPENARIKNLNFIYGDKMAAISLNPKLPVATVISDADIAQTQRIMFEALWSQCQ